MICQTTKEIKRVMGDVVPAGSQFQVDLKRDTFANGIFGPEISIKPYTAENIICPTRHLRVREAETMEETQMLLNYIQELRNKKILLIRDLTKRHGWSTEDNLFISQDENYEFLQHKDCAERGKRNILFDIVLESLGEFARQAYVVCPEDRGVQLFRLNDTSRIWRFMNFNDAMRHFNKL